MRGVREAVSDLNQDSLPSLGLKLDQEMKQYIDSAIELVSKIFDRWYISNIILILFLRSWRATVIIDYLFISIVAAFVATALKIHNVISLAGIAFAVGMVVDAAIVVLENIYSIRKW